MSSPKLKKAATESKFQCSFDIQIEPSNTNVPPNLKAEFIDGSVWETKTDKFDCSELRNLFFEKAAAVEDAIERAGMTGVFSPCISVLVRKMILLI